MRTQPAAQNAEQRRERRVAPEDFGAVAGKLFP